MKNLFNLLLMQASMLACIGFVCINTSCSSDDDGDSSPWGKGKRLSSVETTEHREKDEDYIMLYQYDEKGRVSKIIIPGNSYSPATFDYTDEEVHWQFKYNHAGLIKNSRVIYTYCGNYEGSGSRDVTFDYDDKGRMIRINSKYFGLKDVTLEWEGNNIVKITKPGWSEITIKYTKNKAHGLTLQDEFNPICVFGYHFDYYKWHDHFIYYTGLCGLISEHLPSEMTWTRINPDYERSGETKKFEYTFDDSGYPITAKRNSYNLKGQLQENAYDNIIMYMKWE